VPRKRKQVLASMVPSPGADTNWIKVALQEKSKQSAMTTMMQQVHNQYQTNIATKTAEATSMNAKKKRKAKPKKAKEKPYKAAIRNSFTRYIKYTRSCKGDSRPFVWLPTLGSK
jgi:hypothetical protein